MNAMILAAGLGTRLRPLTDRIPKPAVPFLNVPLLLYNEYLLRQLHFDKIVVNTHHLPKQIENVASRFAVRNVIFSHEAPHILGSGGGIWKAQSHLTGQGDFIVCNGDSVLLPKEKELLPNFLKAHRASGALATVMVMKHPEVGRQFNGVWLDSSNRLVGLGKTEVAPDTRGYHFIGIMALSEKIFDYLPPGESNVFHDAILPALARGEKVFGYPAQVEWFETGDEISYLAATKSVVDILWAPENSIQKTFLQHFLKDHLPKMKIPRPGEPITGEGTHVESGATLEGIVVLGSHVRVSSNARLRNVVVLDNTQIGDSVTVENHIIY
jgi:mannose-1-phosphate guanylyltransferase